MAEQEKTKKNDGGVREWIAILLLGFMAYQMYDIGSSLKGIESELVTIRIFGIDVDGDVDADVSGYISIE